MRIVDQFNWRAKAMQLINKDDTIAPIVKLIPNNEWDDGTVTRYRVE